MCLTLLAIKASSSAISPHSLLAMASAVANNFGPRSVQLEGQAKVKAAKEKEAKHALQKERIQNGKDIQVINVVRKYLLCLSCLARD